VLATIQDIVAAAPVAFLAGLIVGFVASDRYRIVRRNGNKEPD
jgi:hypothetical protein